MSVNESDNSAMCNSSVGTGFNECQYRIESNNASPGNVVSYSLYVIQTGDSSGFSALSPSVTDSNSGSPTSGTFTVTLDANDSLVINKGTTSSGGTIKVAGITRSLTNSVEVMSISASGPSWPTNNPDSEAPTVGVF